MGLSASFSNNGGNAWQSKSYPVQGFLVLHVRSPGCGEESRLPTLPVSHGRTHEDSHTLAWTHTGHEWSCLQPRELLLLILRIVLYTSQPLNA